jgi:hypothetical protein
MQRERGYWGGLAWFCHGCMIVESDVWSV